MQPIHIVLQGAVWRFHSAGRILVGMITKTKALLFAVLVVLALAGFRQETSDAYPGVEFSKDGQTMQFPQDYRQWVYLSSGYNMSYNPDALAAQAAGHSMFDNVFVKPENYKEFLKTGTWPDKTMFVLEVRSAESNNSINKHGNSQGEVMGLEVHVKDEARFPGTWAFYGSNDGKIGKSFPADATCYTCHQAHGAVDTTFVQFYPTLMPIAKSKGTLSAEYLKDEKEAAAAAPAKK
jgi:hypothetical protein